MTEKLTPPAYEVAPETWIIPEILPAGPDAWLPVNSALIRGAEPVIIDTGTALNRDRWTETVFGLVDPEDVRWIYLSHDDHDHVGNLVETLELCPNATLVTTWFSIERLSGDFALPLDRARWVNDGETFDVGDRTLVSMRPPIWDNPTSRGLFDPTTGFYWGVDAFAMLMPGPVTDAADVPSEMFEETLLYLNRLLAPWHTMLDHGRFNDLLAGLRSLSMTTIASSHGATLNGERLARAWELLAQLPGLPEVTVPDQADLDAILAANAILPDPGPVATV